MGDKDNEYEYDLNDVEVVVEKEKAYLLKFNHEGTTIEDWFPKSKVFFINKSSNEFPAGKDMVAISKWLVNKKL